MMSAGDFVIAAILLWYSKKERTKGKTGTLYLILYSIGRFILEFYRGDLIRGNVGALTTSQFIAIFVALAGVVLIAVRKGRT